MADRASLNTIKTNIASILTDANTTTASPIDLSANLASNKRVKKVLKVNPEMIIPQASIFPLVTCYIENKNIKADDIAKTQLDTKRRSTVVVNVVGSVWNNNYRNFDEDPADEDINYLMENIELILRSNYNLSGAVNWQKPSGVEYFSTILNNNNHLRSGILKLECEVFY